MWGWIAYDPDLNLIYYGTGNPGPWNQEQRPADNKWTTTLFARDPDTGAAKWALKYNPHDEHDYDGINEHILVDMNVNGKLRKLLLHPDRNGHLYEVDRESGEILSAKPYGYVNSVLSIDLKTGRPVMNPDPGAIAWNCRWRSTFRWEFAAAKMRCSSASTTHSKETMLQSWRFSPRITCRFCRRPLSRPYRHRIETQSV